MQVHVLGCPCIRPSKDVSFKRLQDGAVRRHGRDLWLLRKRCRQTRGLGLPPVTFGPILAPGKCRDVGSASMWQIFVLVKYTS
ncbi:unnamed protein product [Choristocarpus tenellus]